MQRQVSRWMSDWLTRLVGRLFFTCFLRSDKRILSLQKLPAKVIIGVISVTVWPPLALTVCFGPLPRCPVVINSWLYRWARVKWGIFTAEWVEIEDKRGTIPALLASLGCANDYYLLLVVGGNIKQTGGGWMDESMIFIGDCQFISLW